MKKILFIFQIYLIIFIYSEMNYICDNIYLGLGSIEAPQLDSKSLGVLQSTFTLVAISLNSSITSILFSLVFSINIQELLIDKSFSPST